MAALVTPLTPKTFLCVAAHPDDIECGAGGTVAKFVAGGAKGYYFILTNANKGTNDRATQPDQLRDRRREEQQAAAQALGITEVFFGDYEDGALEVTQDLKRDIVRAIRQVKPDIVITTDPTAIYSADQGVINHPDHRAAGQATLDAVYPLACSHLIFPELLAEGLEPHKVGTVLMPSSENQNFLIDVTDHMEAKLKAVGLHASQLADPDAMFKMLRFRAEQTGSKAGARYAESFVRIDVTGFNIA